MAVLLIMSWSLVSYKEPSGLFFCLAHLYKLLNCNSYLQTIKIN